MKVQRNFGEMPVSWQDRNPKNKECAGFKVIFADGFTTNHYGGLVTLSDDMVREHGAVKEAKEI